MTRTWTTRHASKARKHLTESDPRFGKAISDLDLIRPGPLSDPYLALLQSIIAQQLSVKAAATIQSRVFALFPNEYPDSAPLLRKRDLTLHRAGLSRAKVKSVKAVARAHQDGQLDLNQMRTQSDEELIAQLTEIWGVGVWTVQMLLMFSLNRPDILPLRDVGIQNAMKRMYGLDEKGKDLHARMEHIADVWRPWRSVACRYLWRWLHNTPL